MKIKVLKLSEKLKKVLYMLTAPIASAIRSVKASVSRLNWDTWFMLSGMFTHMVIYVILMYLAEAPLISFLGYLGWEAVYSFVSLMLFQDFADSEPTAVIGFGHWLLTVAAVIIYLCSFSVYLLY